MSEFARRIVAGEAPKEEIKEMLVSLNRNGVGPADVLSLALAFQEASVPAYTDFPVVADLCGTGGGAIRTFNISTAASFVVAGCGVPVAKHGNRSNAGRSGSADVLEALGARLRLSPGGASMILDSIGYSFFFAPSFNPAMRNAAEARREMGGRTIFNVLGPLLNPVRARRRQLIGVSDAGLLDVLPPVLGDLGIERAFVVHGSPGIDEVSTLGSTEAVLVEGHDAQRLTIRPQEMGLDVAAPIDLADRAPMPSAVLVRQLLHLGQPAPARDVVLLNAACALFAFGRANDLDHGLRLAEHSLASGRAAQRMERFVALSRKCRAD
ncbi:MAG TPA: anthranilate phosphoribosyltransferase [Methanomassiliicoccales archaeon]|nr:anthranilate phosphoribosyltransferase [Methanomassiliicoccales archaeon]